MNCKNCNNSIPNGAKFCGKCGKSVLSQNLNTNNTPQLSGENKKNTSVMEMAKRGLKIMLVILLP